MHSKSSIYQADWDNSPGRKPPLRKKYLPLQICKRNHEIMTTWNSRVTQPKEDLHLTEFQVSIRGPPQFPLPQDCPWPCICRGHGP